MSAKKHGLKLSHDCEFFLVTDISVYACECTPHHILIDNVEYVQIENNFGKSLLDFLQEEFDNSNHGNTTQVQYCYKDFERAAIRYMQSNTESLQAFKQYVHDRLDKMGIPADPEPDNNAAHGCRIEGRLNVVEKMMGNNVA